MDESSKKETIDEKYKVSHKLLDEVISNPSVTDVSLKHDLDTLRERAREHITSKLLLFVGFLYGSFLLVGSFLVFFGKITFRDLLDLILALGAFSGLLGTAINFYFKS